MTKASRRVSADGKRHLVPRSACGRAFAERFACMTACLVIAVGDIEMPEYSEGLRVRMTRRWREMDSNFRFRRERTGFRASVCRLRGIGRRSGRLGSARFCNNHAVTAGSIGCRFVVLPWTLRITSATKCLQSERYVGQRDANIWSGQERRDHGKLVDALWVGK